MTANTEKLNLDVDILIKDRNGDYVHHLCNYKGVGVPYDDEFDPTFKQRLSTLHTMAANPNDVLICAYPRTGNQWTWDIVMMALRGKAAPITDIRFLASLIDLTTRNPDRYPEGRVIFTHYQPHMIPKDFFEKKCKIIVVNRNPKDVAVSFYAMHKESVLCDYSGGFSQFLDVFLKGGVMYGSWFDHTKAWEDFFKSHPDIPHISLTYEQLHSDLVGKVRQISEFLERPRDTEFYMAVAEASGFQTSKTAKAHLIGDTEKLLWKSKQDIFLRKGKVGTWKDWFIVVDNDRFDEAFQQQMLGRNMEIDYGEYAAKSPL